MYTSRGQGGALFGPALPFSRFPLAPEPVPALDSAFLPPPPVVQERAVDPTRMEEVLDMAAVHGFYVSLLEDVLGHAIPVPHEVAAKTRFPRR